LAWRRPATFFARQDAKHGGLFISVSDPPPVGTKLRLSFEVPGGNVQAEAIVRNIVPGEGMGVEFKKLRLKDRILLENLLKRLLR